MKTLAASILICLSLSSLTAFSPVRRESCSCAAADGTCEASITCTDGCIALCPSRDCRAACTRLGRGNGEVGTEEYVNLKARVTLKVKGGSSSAISAELARVTGREIIFIPAIPDDTFTVDVTDEPLWNVLESLSARGRLRIAGDDFSNVQFVRQALLRGDRISLCVYGTPIKRLLYELEYLTGLDYRITSGDHKATVNFTAKDVNLDEIVAQVSERTGVQIAFR